MPATAVSANVNTTDIFLSNSTHLAFGVDGSGNANSHIVFDGTNLVLDSDSDAGSGGAIVFDAGGSERGRITSGGVLLLAGITSAGVSNTGIEVGGGNGSIRSQRSIVPTGNTASLIIGRRFCGLVVVSSVNAANASVRTTALYAAHFYENDSTSISLINSDDGSGGGSSFTVGYADANGDFTVTNTAGADRSVTISAYGHKSL